MPKKKNNQGFTLVELIVVITILGIILILALPQVQRIQSNNKTKKYETYGESIEAGAKLFIDSHAKDLFGNNNSGCVTIKYSDLKTSNLIKDYQEDGITCSNDDETYVEVRKSNDNYTYQTAITCRQGSKVVYKQKIESEFTCSNSGEMDNGGPTVEVTPDTIDWSRRSNINVNIIVSDVSGLNRNIGITYYWTDSAGNIVGEKHNYNYKNKTNVQKVTMKIDEKNIPEDTGEYNLVVLSWESKNTNGIQDALGNKKVLSSNFGPYKIDETAPTCGNKTGESTSWSTSSRNISVACNDTGSGCTKPSFSQNFTTAQKTGTITIEDKVGLKTNCTVNVYIDKSKPNVPTSTLRENNSSGTKLSNSNSWTNKTIWWGEFESTGSTSPIDHYEYSDGCTGKKTGNLASSYTYNYSLNKNYCIRAVNQAGTASNWSSAYYFRIDKTAPTISGSLRKKSGGSYTQGSWSREALIRNVSASDTGGSELKEIQYYSGGWHKENNTTNYQINQTNSTIKFRALDNAGNYSDEITMTYRVDWTAPSITVGPRTNGDTPLHAGHIVHINIYYTDNLSGLNYRDITGNIVFPRTYFNGLMTTKGTNIDYLGLYSYGTIRYSVTVCDNAGNCSSASGTR